MNYKLTTIYLLVISSFLIIVGVLSGFSSLNEIYEYESTIPNIPKHTNSIPANVTKEVNLYEFIKSVECPHGPTLIAYPDAGRYSIGCGTKSYKGEIISESEANARFNKIVSQSYKKVTEDMPNLGTNTQIALTSLYFNCTRCYQDIRDNGLTKERFMSYVMSNGKYMRGLQERREKEGNLLLTK